MYHLAFELVQPGNVWPFEVVEDACRVQKQIPLIFELSYFTGPWYRLAKLDPPFAGLFNPLGVDDFGIESLDAMNEV
jgi:hypothetical protein